MAPKAWRERKLLSLSIFPRDDDLPSRALSISPRILSPTAGITVPLDKPTEMLVKNKPAASTPTSSWLSPSQMTNLYGVNLVDFGTIQGTFARWQTISDHQTLTTIREPCVRSGRIR